MSVHIGEVTSEIELRTTGAPAPPSVTADGAATAPAAGDADERLRLAMTQLARRARRLAPERFDG